MSLQRKVRRQRLKKALKGTLGKEVEQAFKDGQELGLRNGFHNGKAFWKHQTVTAAFGLTYEEEVHEQV